MKKLILFASLIFSVMAVSAQTAPISPTQLTTNTAYYEPSTHNRWFNSGGNGVTPFWWQAVDSVQMKRNITVALTGYLPKTDTIRRNARMDSIKAANYANAHTYNAVQTYTVSPVVPTATTSGQVVNLGQLTAGYQPIGSYALQATTISPGYGLTGGGSLGANRIFIADTASTIGLVSKSRLATNLGGYVKTSSAVSSVFGRIGAVVATLGDYNTSQVTENTNLYYTDTRARAAISTTGSLTYNLSTGVLNYPLDTANVVSGVNASKTTLRSAVLYTYGSGFFTLPFNAPGLPAGINQNSDAINGIFLRHSNLSNNKGLWLFNQIGTNGLYYTSYDGFTASSYKVWDSGNLTSTALNTIYGYTPGSLSGNNTWSGTNTFASIEGSIGGGSTIGLNSPFSTISLNSSIYKPNTAIFNGNLTTDISISQLNNKLLIYYSKNAVAGATNYGITLDAVNLTATRSLTWQNKSGAIALTNDNISEFTNDANYLTTTTGLSKTGGALTGGLSGTSGTFSSTLTGLNIYGTSATPSIAAFSGAGTGATISVVGNNNSGIITFTTGTSPVSGGTLCNLTMANGFSLPIAATGIAQINTGGAALPAGVTLNTNSTTTVFQINVAGGALLASTTYKINYIISGN